jgi:hypothetical protein
MSDPIDYLLRRRFPNYDAVHFGMTLPPHERGWAIPSEYRQTRLDEIEAYRMWLQVLSGEELQRLCAYEQRMEREQLKAQAEFEGSQQRPSAETVSDPKKNAFDPLPLSGIADMFRLDTDDNKNSERWRKLAERANRNGLSEARMELGRGSAESRFDPLMVADWLVEHGIKGMTRERVNRILANNLPERSQDLKHLFDPEAR